MSLIYHFSSLQYYLIDCNKQYDMKFEYLKQLQLMHNFNPPHKYSHKTRMGNWSEEWDLEEAKRKEYIRQKHQGVSSVNHKESMLVRSLQSVAKLKDGLRRFGDHVMLFNGKKLVKEVTDIHEKVSATEQFYSMGAVKNIHAAARSVFILERANHGDGFKDSVVHYGQAVRIRINPLLIDKPIYLYSEPASMNHFSKVSRLQEVLLAHKTGHNTTWVLEHPDPNQRLEATGHPVGCDDTVLIKHEMTNQWLAADNKQFESNFGKEYQVMAHNFLVNNKSQNLIQEKRGISTIDIPARNQKDENLWLVMGANSPDQEFDESIVRGQVVNKFTLEKKIKQLLTERGVYGMRFLHKVLNCLDTQKTGGLDQNDFKWGLQSGKVFLNDDELNFLVKEYGANGRVGYRLLLSDLRGKMNDNRYKSIVDAYRRCEKLIGGRTTLEELGKIYDAKRHPEVMAGRKDERESFNEFVWSWDNIKPGYTIELQQFAAYFEDLSCMIPRDEHFEYLLLSVFHL